MEIPKTLGSFIWYFIKKQRVLFFTAQFFAFAWTIDQLAWPYVMKILIDKITDYTGNGSDVWSYLSVPIIMGLSLWLIVETFFRLTGFLQAYGIPKLEAQVRMTMFDYVQKHSYRYFSDNFAGTLSNKISDMTGSMTRIVQMCLWLFAPASLALILSTIFFALVNPFFGIILGSWIILHMSISFYFCRSCDYYSLVHSEARSDLTGKVVDALSNHINIRLFAKKDYELKFLKKYQDDEKQKNFQSLFVIEKMKFFLGVASFLGPGILLNGYILSQWGQGQLSTGDVIYLFNTTWNVMTMAWYIGLELPQFFREIGIGKQALSIIKEPHEIIDKNDAKPLNVKRGEIKFEDVTFKYGKQQEALFEDKNLTLHPGEKVGLVGFSGSGKTSLVHLILRYYDVNKGRILIDGQNINEITLDSLHNAIALIPQDPSLFHRSIRENVLYGKENATEEEFLDAARKAHIDEFVEKMPLKYDSLVGDRGVKLSGGQRQRIAIARAILKNAPILILDEATSALDSVTEKLIQEGLTTLMDNKTTLVIAHRLSTLSGMDRILVFDEGCLVEEGTHEELIKMKGHYAHLWAMQAGGFLPDKQANSEPPNIETI